MRASKLFLFATTALVACAGAAQAQVTYARDGGVQERIESILITAKPGAPFEATVATSWKRRLEDGTETTIYNHRTVARDSTGRVFQERRSFSATGNVNPTPISELDYYDPVRKEMTVCEPMRKMCTVRESMVPVDDPPPQPLATTTPQGVKITREAIGEKSIDNLQVKGSNEIIVRPSQGESEPTVKELWYSPLLGFNVEVKRFEPRGGAQDIAMQNINRTEPDPQLFQLPQDYGITRMVREKPPTPAVAGTR